MFLRVHTTSTHTVKATASRAAKRQLREHEAVETAVHNVAAIQDRAIPLLKWVVAIELGRNSAQSKNSATNNNISEQVCSLIGRAAVQ
jgi:hypothetical protein